MEEHVYKQIEITGSSATSLEEAVQNAVARATKTLRHLRWFKVLETRGVIENGSVAMWQVTVKIGFRMED
jgi:flavin-binding protein dodecin